MEYVGKDNLTAKSLAELLNKESVLKKNIISITSDSDGYLSVLYCKEENRTSNTFNMSNIDLDKIL